MRLASKNLKKATLFFFLLWMMTLGLKNSIFEFHPRYISFDSRKIPSQVIDEFSNDDDEIENILKNSFKFIGKGNQSFVFQSKDQKWVIKIFNFSHLKTFPLESKLFPKSYRTKQRKIERIFTSHNLAFKENKHHSGLMYAHLKPTQHLPTIQFIDRWNKSYLIDLNQAFFVIQKKGETTRQVIGRFLDQKQLKIAMTYFYSLLDMYLDEYSRGLWDQDHNLMHNTGFAEGVPLRIDVGKVFYDPYIIKNYKIDLEKIIHIRISRWLKRYYPHDHDEIIKSLEQRYLK